MIRYSFFLLFCLFASGCGTVDQSFDDSLDSEVLVTDQTPLETDEPTRYMLFTVNTQEFIYPVESAETLHRALDIHEKYDVPVDVFLTEDIFRAYEEVDPGLISRLSTSSLVAISTHFRPPHPYHIHKSDDLDSSTPDLDELLLSYATHATDPVTGAVMDAPGGYQHIADGIGYGPLMVGMASVDADMRNPLTEVLRSLGLRMVVTHNTPLSVGDMRFGLPVRPEDVGIITPEYIDGVASEVILDAWDSVGDEGFVNVKVHDNDFIADASAWTSIYLRAKSPFDLDRGVTNRSLLSSSESDAHWTFYEDAVRYVSENRDLYSAVNGFDLLEMTR